MRLKKIEVLGFKSFADRQVVLVDDHVTGVIGPNGCGKSNIVDAIRWCMGEQSAKHLRGAGMGDVIFAGCSTRGPGGMAEVTLTLTNSGDAPPPYGEMSEIAITRRLFADGTSEYLINKVPARLRDITDLLAGTGVGTKGYSIIEQGQVGKIVGSKPEERRLIIDEAAGITRFKAQKAAATRKIDGTRQNLLRVRDVIAELEDRLGTLRRQAQKAERYKNYRQELREHELWSASQRLLELQALRGVLQSRRASLGQQIEDVRTSLQARESQITGARAALAEVEARLAEQQQQVYDLDNRARLREAEDDYHRRERDAQVQAHAQAQAEGEAASRALAQVQAELAEIDAERLSLGDPGEDAGGEQALARLEAEAQGLEAELWTERSRREAAQGELGERTNALAAAKSRVESLAESTAGLVERAAQGEVRLAELQNQGYQADRGRAELRRQAMELRETLESARGRRQALDRQRSELRQQIASTEVELDTQRAEVHRARSRLQSLEEIQSRYRSCASGVQVVMEHRQELGAEAGVGGGGSPGQRGVLGIVADYISAPAHLESAVSAVLGDRIEGVVVEAPGDATRGVELLKRAQEGRLSFLPRFPRGVQGQQRAEAPLGWRQPSRGAAQRIEVVDMTGAAEGSDGSRAQTRPTQSGLPELSGGQDAVAAAEDGEAMATEDAVAAAQDGEAQATEDAVAAAEDGEAMATEDAVAAAEDGEAQATEDAVAAAEDGEAMATEDAVAAAEDGEAMATADVVAAVPSRPSHASPTRPFVPVAGVVGRLIDLVQCSPELGDLAQVLLGETVVVEGLSRALELWQAKQYPAALVTLDGDRIEPSGVVVGGSPTALNAALLQQKREIRDLGQILEELQQAFEATRGRHLALAEAAAALELEREGNEGALLSQQTQLAACEAELSAAEAQWARVEGETEAGRRELERLGQELTARRHEAAELERTAADLAARIAELEQDATQAGARAELLAAERETLVSGITEAKVALARWQQKSDALVGTRARLVRQLEAEQIRLTRVEETRSRAQARVEELSNLLAQSQGELETIVANSREATAAVHLTRERHEAMSQEVGELEASMKTLRAELEEHRERLQEVDLGLREHELELAHLHQDVRERLDVDLTAVLVDYHDRPLCGPEQRERIAELKRVLARMGEVNLTAIDEFDQVSQRYEYLVGQRDDLEQAVAQLQDAIDRIDKTTRQMFRDTFAAVNERFQHIFPRLFAGGRAELKLTDPDDPLGTGIEIVAQPPGKQLRSLDLLSGGEKALTAVSLIFAIFLIKPSPFCLLDEVDAPLDDVNVGRFCGLVRELSAQTQFIVITHNKVSMETADRLYGVTMEQRGVSKLVSVNVRRAVALAYN